MKPLVATQLFELARERIARRCLKRDRRSVHRYCSLKECKDATYRRAGGTEIAILEAAE